MEKHPGFQSQKSHNSEQVDTTPASDPTKAIVIYLAFTLLFSSIVWYLTIHATQQGRLSGRLYGYAIMWCPALATLVTCRLLHRKITGLAWQWGNPKYQFWSYLTPLLYSTIAYSLVWLLGFGGFYNETFVNQAARELGWDSLPDPVFIILFFASNAVIGILGSLSTALGEEIGWRGFLVPELMKKTNYTRTSLISGFIWAIWHYPLLIWGNYNNGTPAWYGLICFTVLVVSISFVFTWFRIKSGSLWTAAMLHASHNLFVQSFFTPITTDTGHTKWFIDEFGAALPAVTVLFAFYFWTRRKELTILGKV